MRPKLEKVITEIEKVIVGKRPVIEKILMALLAEGHVLLDDVPGVGKTTMAVALSRAIGLSYQRVQFTPDVLPSDLVGFSMPDRESGGFVYRPGALNHANLLLGDEINRASSKTQSALLEAMEEQQVTVDGNTYPLQKPFLVIATQNSVGAAGTQPLPYAQMDRFLVRLSLGYPDYEAQMTMLRERQGQNPMERVQTVLSRESLLSMQRDVQKVTSKDAILDYIIRLTIASRQHELIEVGISPRGALFLDRMAKAKAYLDGRDYVTGTDVQAVFKDVCTHRVLLRETAGDKTVDDALDSLLKTVETPDHHNRLIGMLKK
ncbi:MAG: MoxR family ATPase [Clostridia bacterium]|nr:MoxR family ATPase [Clostridia bacterium]